MHSLVFPSPDEANLTLRVYPSFFEEGVAPAFLLVEALGGDPVRAPVGLQAWVSTRSGRVPAPEEVAGLLDEHGVVCRAGDLMPDDPTVEAW